MKYIGSKLAIGFLAVSLSLTPSHNANAQAAGGIAGLGGLGGTGIIGIIAVVAIIGAASDNGGGDNLRNLQPGDIIPIPTPSTATTTTTTNQGSGGGSTTTTTTN